MRRFFVRAMIAVAAPAAALAIGAAPALGAGNVPSLPVHIGQRSMAPVPTAAGCYVPDGTNWRRVDCDTQTYIARHIPHPEVLAGVGGTTAQGHTAGRFTVGEVSAGSIGSATEVDSKYGAGAYSIQDNVFFNGPNGQLDSDQFTDQSGFGVDNVCVWQIDVITQKYAPTCLTPSQDGQAPVSNVEGFSSEGYVGTAAETDEGVVLGVTIARDKYGLGQGDNWSNNSGSILGYGNGSQAVFSAGSQLLIEDSASSCQNDLGFVKFALTCKPRPVKPLAYTGYSPGPLTLGAFTVESNNLIPVTGTPPAFLPAIQYFNKYTANITYAATTSGSCFTGSPPDCL